MAPAIAKSLLRQTVLAKSVPAYTIRYEGHLGGFYAFRLSMGAAPALDKQALRNRMYAWLMQSYRKGGWAIGNNFPHLPEVVLNGPAGDDQIILLTWLDQVRVFEDRFKILGFTPTMKM